PLVVVLFVVATGVFHAPVGVHNEMIGWLAAGFLAVAATAVVQLVALPGCLLLLRSRPDLRTGRSVAPRTLALAVALLAAGEAQEHEAEDRRDDDGEDAANDQADHESPLQAFMNEG